VEVGDPKVAVGRTGTADGTELGMGVDITVGTTDVFFIDGVMLGDVVLA
jgi:hypothetical protein